MPRKTSGPPINESIWPMRDASMRPRPDAAENRGAAAKQLAAIAASMRPRPDAAENTVEQGRRLPPPGRFNEAAARCRGKLVGPGRIERPPRASMRPRPDAAENRVDLPFVEAVLAASMRPRPDAAENA